MQHNSFELSKRILRKLLFYLDNPHGANLDAFIELIDLIRIKYDIKLDTCILSWEKYCGTEELISAVSGFVGGLSYAITYHKFSADFVFDLSQIYLCYNNLKKYHDDNDYISPRFFD